MVWCNCANNHLVKDISEWCEWCKCDKCGRKGQRYASRSAGTADLGGLEINSDLLLLLSIYGAVAFALVYVEDFTYMYLHTAGAVAAAHLVRNSVPFATKL